MRDAGFSFTYADIDAEEDFPESLKNEEVAMYLAKKKSSHYKMNIGNKVLVCADTIVCLEDEIINKPVDADDAFQMLNKLSVKMHLVFTGVSLRNDEKEILFFEKSEVWFYTLTAEEINHYIENYKPFDKAGAYGVQDWMGYIGVKKINGCFYNVMGFPISRFYREFQDFIS